MAGTAWIWLVGLGGIVVGFVFGLMFSRFGSSEARRQLETERRLQEAEDRLSNYRDDVTGHFRQTADLVNRLVGDYRAIHHHLADGAQRLCAQSGVTEKLLEGLAEPTEPQAQQTEGESAAQVAPPLDYAPRRSPKERGVLHEDYGFEKSSN